MATIAVWLAATASATTAGAAAAGFDALFWPLFLSANRAAHRIVGRHAAEDVAAGPASSRILVTVCVETTFDLPLNAVEAIVSGDDAFHAFAGPIDQGHGRSRSLDFGGGGGGGRRSRQ